MDLCLNLVAGMVFFAAFLSQTKGQYFTSGPSSVTIYEGQDAVFTVESPYATDCSSNSHYFTWYRIRGGGRGDPSCLPTSQLYRLTIRNTQPGDSGNYGCKLVFSYPYQVYESTRATLTVLSLPKINPSCTFEPARPTVGTLTTLTCALSSLDPSLLTWYESQPSFPNRLGAQYNQPGQLYTIQRVLTEADNIINFTCVAGPYPNGPSCFTTPLQIPTTVSISPSHLTLHEHENATFTCDFKSIPQHSADIYEWRVLKDGIPEVEINQELLQNQDGLFELTNNGITLQIINVTLEEFHNAQIRCSAFYNEIEYTSDNESLLVVLPWTSMTTTATERNSEKNNDMNSAGSNTVRIIAGVLSSVVFLIILTLLGVYLIKYKPSPARPGQTAVTRRQSPPIDERAIVTNEFEIGPMYDQVQGGNTTTQNRQIQSDLILTHAEGLYTFPDKAGGEIRRYVVSPSSTIDDGDGTECIKESIYSEAGQQSGQAVYAMPEKGPRSPAMSDAEDIGPQQKNVEGLAYAELDLQRPSSATQTIINTSVEDSTCYADICTD
ncbi:uncharacterized protein LOC117296508 [Asterias rubens]|uniref:uncharacterized protein LOC117296508 n=1 Tax=Asterias rubens TaxID=7604 RepID=UPI00145579F7|nr:uncharacterized protein LOC117296508 [Asterias rubens]